MSEPIKDEEDSSNGAIYAILGVLVLGLLALAAFLGMKKYKQQQAEKTDVEMAGSPDVATS